MVGVTEGCEVEPGAGRPEPGASIFPAVALSLGGIVTGRTSALAARSWRQ
jgi:hypothetical protein